MKIKLILTMLFFVSIGMVNTFAACNVKDANGKYVAVEFDYVIKPEDKTVFAIGETDEVEGAPRVVLTYRLPGEADFTETETSIDIDVSSASTSDNDKTFKETLAFGRGMADEAGDCELEVEFKYTVFEVDTVELADPEKNVAEAGTDVDGTWFTITTKPTGHQDNVAIDEDTATVEDADPFTVTFEAGTSTADCDMIGTSLEVDVGALTGTSDGETITVQSVITGTPSQEVDTELTLDGSVVTSGSGTVTYTKKFTF